MEHSMDIHSDQRNGNLHIRLSGKFSHDMAMSVSYHILKSYRGTGNIFIHTNDITDVAPRSQTVFGQMVGLLDLPRDHIYLMGERGMDIGYEKAKILMPKKKKRGGCGAGCGSCKCGTPKELQ